MSKKQYGGFLRHPDTSVEEYDKTVEDIIMKSKWSMLPRQGGGGLVFKTEDSDQTKLMSQNPNTSTSDKIDYKPVKHFLLKVAFINPTDEEMIMFVNGQDMFVPTLKDIERENEIQNIIYTRSIQKQNKLITPLCATEIKQFDIDRLSDILENSGAIVKSRCNRIISRVKSKKVTKIGVLLMELMNNYSVINRNIITRFINIDKNPLSQEDKAFQRGYRKIHLMTALLGYIHGDAHTGNILVPHNDKGENDFENMILIDWGHVKECPEYYNENSDVLFKPDKFRKLCKRIHKVCDILRIKYYESELNKKYPEDKKRVEDLLNEYTQLECRIIGRWIELSTNEDELRDIMDDIQKIYIDDMNPTQRAIVMRLLTNQPELTKQIVDERSSSRREGGGGEVPSSARSASGGAKQELIAGRRRRSRKRRLGRRMKRLSRKTIRRKH